MASFTRIPIQSISQNDGVHMWPNPRARPTTAWRCRRSIYPIALPSPSHPLPSHHHSSVEAHFDMRHIPNIGETGAAHCWGAAWPRKCVGNNVTLTMKMPWSSSDHICLKSKPLNPNICLCHPSLNMQQEKKNPFNIFSEPVDEKFHRIIKPLAWHM